MLVGIVGDIEEARNDELLFVQAVGGANSMHAEVAVDGRVRLVIEYLLNEASLRHLGYLALMTKIFSECFSTEAPPFMLTIG